MVTQRIPTHFFHTPSWSKSSQKNSLQQCLFIISLCSFCSHMPSVFATPLFFLFLNIHVVKSSLVIALAVMVKNVHAILGGHFGPEKKYLAPPPSPIRCRHPPGHSAPPLLETPPLLGFSIKNRPPPPPGASDSPFRLPEPKK